MSNESTLSGLSGERRAAIRARLKADERANNGWRSLDASDLRDLLAAVDQITHERDKYAGELGFTLNDLHTARHFQQQAEAALVVLTQRQEWQPIETAPKDTHVLVWWPYWRATAVVAKFSTALHRWESEAALQADAADRPAKWMPLPSVPKGLGY